MIILIVGITFIARISKGRTIREVAMGMLIIPTIMITFMMTILGASGIYVNELNGGVISKAISSNIATSMFEMFRYLTSSPLVQNVLSCVVITGIPFAILLLIMMFSLKKELKVSYKNHEFNTVVKLKRKIDKMDEDQQYQ